MLYELQDERNKGARIGATLIDSEHASPIASQCCDYVHLIKSLAVTCYIICPRKGPTHSPAVSGAKIALVNIDDNFTRIKGFYVF